MTPVNSEEDGCCFEAEAFDKELAFALATAAAPNKRGKKEEADSDAVVGAEEMVCDILNGSGGDALKTWGRNSGEEVEAESAGRAPKDPWRKLDNDDEPPVSLEAAMSTGAEDAALSPLFCRIVRRFFTISNWDATSEDV